MTLFDLMSDIKTWWPWNQLYVSGEKISELFENCLRMLSFAGFTIKALTTDNHRVNQNFIFDKTQQGTGGLCMVSPGT